MLRQLFKHRDEVKRLGRYTVLGELGRGGMGTVLEAYDDELDRRVALKLLHPSYKERQGKRLRREAQALAKLSHPNVVQVFEVGEIDGLPFVALELVEGQTLEQWQSQRRRPGWRRCVEVYLEVGRGLAAAHAVGLVHRDFKPRNCIVGSDGRARLLDFGLVVREESAITEEVRVEGVAVEPRDDALGSSLTKAGTMMGTPAYMPLEQLEGRTTDTASDQFSFCVSLYEAVYGERPFAGETLQQLAASLANGATRPVPRGRRVPRELRRILLRGLDPIPVRRWPSMNALLNALRRVAKPRVGRRRSLGLTATGALLAVGLSWDWPTDPCAATPSQLAGVWDEAREDEVRTAIVDSGHPLAKNTWGLVESGLDGYAENWVAGYREVCEAGHRPEATIPRGTELRMQCLERRRVELRHTVDLLARPDVVSVERAGELVSRLSPLSRCEQGALELELTPPSPQQAARVEAVRHRLVEASVRRLAGILDGALPNADAIVEDAADLEYGPLRIEALQERADVLDDLGQYDRARDDLEHAHRLALSHDHWQAATQTASALLWVVGHRQSDHAAGLRWGQTALALAKRRATPDWLAAEVDANLGVILREQDRLDEALGYLEQALITQNLALGPEHPTVASTTLEIGNVLLGQGKLDQARVHYERALSIQSEALGPWHPKIAGTRSNIGTMLMGHRELDAAAEHYLAALGIQTEVLGSEHLETAMTLGNLGHVRQLQGRPREALYFHRAALAIQKGQLDADHPDLARTRGNLAGVFLAQDELDDALQYYQLALGGFEASQGSDHVDVAATLDNIGTVLERKGKLGLALRHHERALAIYESRLPSDHPAIANVLSNMGLIQLDRGRLPEAEELLQRSISSVGATHPDLVPPLAGLARLALKRGDASAAREYAERAISIGESTEVEFSYPLAEARFVLAQVLWLDAALRPDARRQAELAMDGFDHTAREEHSEVHRWLDAHPLGPLLPS